MDKIDNIIIIDDINVKPLTKKQKTLLRKEWLKLQQGIQQRKAQSIRG